MAKSSRNKKMQNSRLEDLLRDRILNVPKENARHFQQITQPYPPTTLKGKREMSAEERKEILAIRKRYRFRFKGQTSGKKYLLKRFSKVGKNASRYLNRRKEVAVLSNDVVLVDLDPHTDALNRFRLLTKFIENEGTIKPTSSLQRDLFRQYKKMNELQLQDEVRRLEIIAYPSPTP